MSPAHRFLHADNGGAGFTLPAPRKMHPSEIALTLSADVLRLPYQPAVRLVLAEIVSLHAATAGRCDCSDAHFAARLTLSTNTVSRAVQQLEADGLITKHVDKAAGFHRTLAPAPKAIAEKAATNPYPQNGGSYPQNGGRGTTPKTGVAYPQNEGSPTPKMVGDLPPKWGTNTPYNIPSNIPVNPTPSAVASEGREEKKIEEVLSAPLPSDPKQIVPPVAAPPRKKPGKTDEPAAFADFWQAWPKKEARADAVKAFAKLAPDDQALAASRADTWLAARPDLLDPARYRFIPHATSWLNQARWTDAAPALASTTNASPNPTSYPPRSVNGAKPLGHGGSLARLLAESD